MNYNSIIIIKYTMTYFNSSSFDEPISKNVSYSRLQRHINAKEEKLMKKYNMGYSQLVKALIVEKYSSVFGDSASGFI